MLDVHEIETARLQYGFQLEVHPVELESQATWHHKAVKHVITIVPHALLTHEP